MFGKKIQASCKRTLMYRVQRELRLGKWGVIENMQMTPAGGKYKTTSHKYKMSISDETMVRGSDLTDDRLFLSLANYEDIQKATSKSKEVPYLIDVIGRVHELGNIQTVKAQGEDRKRVEFRLIDSQGNDLACCLWGSYAEQIEAFIDECKDRTIICLIRCAKINFFRGEVQITNAFDASRMYLNPTEPEVLELTERLSDHHLQLAPFEKSNGKKDRKRITYDWNDAEIRSISEIIDGNQIEDPEILPEPILSLVGKSFCFGLSFGSENVTNGSGTFMVLEVCSADKALSIDTNSDAVSEIGTSSSTMSSGDVLMLESISPEDPKTPFSKRKEDDADLNDHSSISKKLCTKMIKQEKTKTEGDKRTDSDTSKTNITTPLDDMPNLSRSPSNSLPISKQPIPLSSIYYRLFETIENHHVPNYTIPLYQQISKFSPQTPRNKRKIFLGLDTIKDQVSDTPEFDKSCLTALSTPSPTFNSSEQTIQEDDSLVGTDLFGGLIDEDNQQVFDCSSLENTDTENEYSDFDDPRNFETDNSDSCSRGDVPKDPKSSYKKDLDEN
ncbi:LOW QUALITY PROTEIN: hypothetical protein HID58_067262, partial [Brassica napus]